MLTEEQKDYFKPYFWDYTIDDSPKFRVQRILEYAWFPDILRYPYEEFKENIKYINFNKLRTSEKRILLFQALLPYFEKCNSWDELFERFIEEQ
ncbi:MAG: hypothetical protein MUE81_06495 [Thermoflexibacter sp.]|nr:hypothetical protein [Thermoflexibacter sp.]